MEERINEFIISGRPYFLSILLLNTILFYILIVKDSQGTFTQPTTLKLSIILMKFLV